MRRGDKVVYPKFRKAGYQRNRFFYGLGAIINTGQDVVVYVDKPWQQVDQITFFGE